MILSAELGKAAPVTKGEIDRIADALAALLRRIDEEQIGRASCRERV